MFTVEQIQAAHSKVRSGADFPAYIQDLKKLGVTYYETFVVDGHTDYYSAGHYKISSARKYADKIIEATCHKPEFKNGLKDHQQGKTDYLSFIEMSARTGVEKWAVCMDKMTCTYYDKTEKEILIEAIPEK